MSLRERAKLVGFGRLKSVASVIWANALRLPRRVPRRLRLCESLPLGEHRFVAVIEFDGEGFLVGGTSASLVLLARVGDAGCKEAAARATVIPDPNMEETGIGEIIGNCRQGIEAC